MEESYSKLFQWYQDDFKEGMLQGSSGCSLRYALQRRTGAVGTLVIVSGRTEFIEKYLELSWDLQDTGLALCLYDHCGQGGSERMLTDKEKGHIDDFETYVDDLGGIIAEIEKKQGPLPIFLLTHSMGGTVSALYAARNPGKIKAMTLVSPMFGIDTGAALPPVIVEAVASLLNKLGAQESYVFGGGPFNPALPYQGNCLTSDERRFTLNMGLMAQDRTRALGSPTFGWLHAAYQAMRDIKRRASQVTCPILLMAAMADSVVSIRKMKDFCRAAPDCRYREFEGAQHELLMEQDWIRSAALQEIKSFFALYSGGPRT